MERVVLATDLGDESPDLFAHGLALAAQTGAELFLVHVADDAHPEATWRRLPTVRALLERWGRLPASASLEAFEALGIRVHPVERRPTDGDLVAAVAHHVAALDPDLLLLGTHHRSGFERLFSPSVSAEVSRDVHRTTMFVGDGSRGLVDETGRVRIARVLVPVSPDVPVQPVVDALVGLLWACQARDVAFTFVQVGGAPVPTPVLPSRTDWMWRTDFREGSVVEQILEASVAHGSDLVAMATEGRQGLLDGLRGSTAERVVRRAGCPVLTVPVRTIRTPP